MTHQLRGVVAAFALVAAGFGPSIAAETTTGVQASQAAPLTGGEVRKVDTAAGKVTLRHEAIANLDMPPMTMVFRAAKPQLIANLKPGDQVQFRATQGAGGALIVTAIELRK